MAFCETYRVKKVNAVALLANVTQYYPVYKSSVFSYSKGMFVSIALDPGSEGRARELADLLGQYGFEKIQRGLWESAFVSPETLTRLKKDLDRATDAFDRLRMFQFPVDGTLALTSLKDKKWRRMVAKGAGIAPRAQPRPAGTGGEANRPARQIPRPSRVSRGPRDGARP
jgi:CRISPR-associated protein Cas2